MRPTFEGEGFADENALLRSCARSVAGLRDADVLLETLAGLRKRLARTRSVDDLAPLERFIRARREAIAPKPTTLARSARLLRGTGERLRLRMRRPMTASSVEKALRTIYRRGRKAYAVACAKSTVESLHRLRKHAKYFANAVGALDDAATKRQTKRAAIAVEVGDRLGKHHDLAAVERAIRESGDLISPAARKTLRSLVATRQRKLRRQALAAARRLYSARPRRVAALC